MYSCSLLVLALAVFGASAQSFGCGFNGVSGLNGFNGVAGCNGFNGVVGFNGLNTVNTGLNTVNTGFNTVNTGLNTVNTGLNTFSTGVGASTPVIENVPLRLPSIVHPTSVQESCNCIKTVVRPTVRKEVYNIPSVQRFVQTTSTPVVETTPFVSGSAVDVPSTGVEGGFIGNGVSGYVSGVNNGAFSGLNNGFVSGVNTGLVSGVNTGFVSGVNTGLVSGVNSGFGCGF